MVRALAKHSHAFVIIGAVGGLEAVALASRRAPWRGEWVWTVDWMGGMVPLVAAAVAGVAAVVARTFGFGARADLLTTTPHPGRALLSPVVVCVASAVAVHMVGLAIAVGLTAVANPSGTLPVLPVVEQVAAIVAAGFAGAVLGTRVRSLVSPALAAGGVVVVAFYASNLGWYPLLDTGGATGSVIGLQHNDSALLIRVGLLAFTTLVLGGLFVARGRWHSPLQLTAVLGLAGVVVYTGFIGPSNEVRFVTDDAPVEYRCATTQDVEVCVVAAHQRFLDDVTEPIGHTVTALDDLGVQVDRRWKERLYGHEQTAATGYFGIPLEAFEGADVDHRRLVSEVIQPRRCFTGPAPPSEEQSSAVTILRAEAATRAGLADGNEWLGGPELLAAFDAGDPDQREAWLRDHYEHLRRCDVDALTRPEWVPAEAFRRR